MLCVVDVFVDMADVVETPRRKKIHQPILFTCQPSKFQKGFTIYGDLKLPTPCWSIMTCSNIEKKLLQNTRSTFHAAIPNTSGKQNLLTGSKGDKSVAMEKYHFLKKPTSSMENGRFFLYLKNRQRSTFRCVSTNHWPPLSFGA